MPTKLTNSDASRALEAEYGTKGRLVVLGLDEVVVPVAEPADHAGRSPWASRYPGAQQRSQAAAGAGRFSGVAITPGGNTILVVDKVALDNVTGANVGMNICFVTEATLQGGAVTLVGSAGLVQLNGLVQPGGGIFRLMALSRNFHANAALNVHMFDFHYSVNLSRTEIVFPRGIVLDGRDAHADAPISLIVQANVANTATPTVIAYGTEYR